MTSNTKYHQKISTHDLCEVALGAVCICLCAWMTIPSVIPFTLQTFAVFLVLLILGGKKGILSVLCYILIGAIGLPVYSGFQGGMGALLGPTGGFIVGLLFIALCYHLFEKFASRVKNWRLLSLCAGLVFCYLLGCLWFMITNTNLKTGTTVSLLKAASVCVFPFLVPDGGKLWLAFWVAKKVNKAR